MSCKGLCISVQTDRRKPGRSPEEKLSCTISRIAKNITLNHPKLLQHLSLYMYMKHEMKVHYIEKRMTCFARIEATVYYNVRM